MKGFDELEFEACLNRWQTRVNRALEALFPTPAGSELSRAMRYAVTNGGKRLRPVLIYGAAELFRHSPPPPALDSLACAVELIHCYSLVHDDLPAMDNDVLRRGLPTCHLAFGEAVAILAADALQPLAFELIATQTSLSANTRTAMIARLTTAIGHQGMVLGQIMDIDAAGAKMSPAELEAMHRHKTGALIRASAMLGAMAGEHASAEELAAVDGYAAEIGLAFQIRDDLIDLQSPSGVSGKTQGADRALDKPTYPSVLGADKATRLALEHRDRAIAHLAHFGRRGEFLKALAHYIVARTS